MMFNKVDSQTLRLNEENERQARDARQEETLEEIRVTTAETIRDGLDIVARTREAEVIDIPSPAGPIPVFVYTPEDVRGLYLHIHGGGWLMGSHLELLDMLIARARRVNVAIASVGYRLAPEYPYPAAPDDCETVVLWLIENATSRFGTRRVVIGGDSAGANLTAVTLTRLRDKHGYTEACGALLISGWYDLRLTPSARGWEGRHLDYTLDLLKKAIRWYVPDGELTNPDVSPLFLSLDKMPPALFMVGSDDGLLDDTLFFEARWRIAGNDTELLVIPGGSHSFHITDTPDGELAQAAVNSFLSRAIS